MNLINARFLLVFILFDEHGITVESTPPQLVVCNHVYTSLTRHTAVPSSGVRCKMTFDTVDFVGGLVSGGLGVVVGQPLSVVIVRMQTAGTWL